MFNYENLNDVEFEDLCRDVMSKMLNVKLRTFAPGKDGGIDLADDASGSNIIVQVKHYTKTSVSGLITSLKKEVEKLNKKKPKFFYVCCSKALSASKIGEIYQMFEQYMASSDNVITTKEIDDFLSNPDNADILRKHYKLWITSTNVLQDICNTNIFIDCEALLSSINTDIKFFVQTQAYDHSLERLSKNKTLFITGDPGTGKTITSKMLVLYYAANGYRVRYTTAGTDIVFLKNSISQDRETKEVVLLDDCFGQAYFNMKESQGKELSSLIKYVNLSANKRLILNSRVTIYREAQNATPELVKSLENKEYHVYILDMNKLSEIEKAKILYNHLNFNNIKEEYFADIKKDKNYKKIIEHKNYNPRLMEFVANPNRYINKVKPDAYFEFILKHLNNPNEVWDDEYTRKLKNVDRIFY